jgi:hypothetical protein
MTDTARRIRLLDQAERIDPERHAQAHKDGGKVWRLSDRDCASLAILKKPSQNSVRHCNPNPIRILGRRDPALNSRATIGAGAFREPPVNPWPGALAITLRRL